MQLLKQCGGLHCSLGLPEHVTMRRRRRTAMRRTMRRRRMTMRTTMKRTKRRTRRTEKRSKRTVTKKRTEMEMITMVVLGKRRIREKEENSDKGGKRGKRGENAIGEEVEG